MHLLPRAAGRLAAPLLAVLVAAAAPSAPAQATAAAPAASTSTAFCPPAAPGHRACLGLALDASARRLAPQRSGIHPSVAAGGPTYGYWPQDIQAAYGLGGTAPTNGNGQTIGIVDAFDDPSAASDLATYRAQFGLPACTVASGCLRKVNQSGGLAPPTADPGWASEITLDLDAASTACPLCHILLVEANNSADSSLIQGVRTAAGLGATVLSLSFGGCEFAPATTDQQAFDQVLQQANRPIAVAAGDHGYNSPDNPDGCQVFSPLFPASSPYVTAVGGTSLLTAGTPRGWAETAWSYAVTPTGAVGTGSGCSTVEAKPAWQSDGGCPHRTVADVSADADPRTGLAVYNSYSDGGWEVYGGTSLAAPLVAGMYALANSPVTAVGGQVWYGGAAVNDVTSGSNAPQPTDCTPAYLCNAITGYDGPTGMGTPNGPPLANPVVTQPASPAMSTAVPVSWSAPSGAPPSSYRLLSREAAGPWLTAATTTAASTTFYGFAGHTYDLAVQYFLATGSSNGPPRQAAVTVAIAANATRATPFTGMYAVDGYGVLHPASSPPLASATWMGWTIVHGVVSSPSGEGGLTLEGYGGLHPFGDAQTPRVSGYWQGWDIATGVATLPGQSSGYVLDGWGGLHPFASGSTAMPANAAGGPYWSGWNIARGLTTFADGSGGLVLDGWGGVHPFTAGAAGAVARTVATAFWSGWDIARSLLLLPGSTSSSYRGYMLDGWGGLHPFASAGTSLPAPPGNTPYWSGWDIARSVVMVPGSSTDGYVVDGFGGFHPFGSAPAVLTGNYGVDAPLTRGASAG